jgi:hypothetical protein
MRRWGAGPIPRLCARAPPANTMLLQTLLSYGFIPKARERVGYKIGGRDWCCT